MYDYAYIYIYRYLLCVFIYISHVYIIYILYIAGFSLLGDRGNPPLAKNLLILPAPGTISSPTKD